MAVDVEKLIRPHLTDIQTYDPVDPPELLAKRAGIAPDKVVKLNGNENPYGGSPKAVAAVANTPLHIYPDPLQRSMRRALAEYTGMEQDSIVVGAGSDELIDLLFRLFIDHGDKIVDFEPTFGMYGFCARVAGGSISYVPRNELFDIDVEAAEMSVGFLVRVAVPFRRRQHEAGADLAALDRCGVRERNDKRNIKAMGKRRSVGERKPRDHYQEQKAGRVPDFHMEDVSRWPVRAAAGSVRCAPPGSGW